MLMLVAVLCGEALLAQVPEPSAPPVVPFEAGPEPAPAEGQAAGARLEPLRRLTADGPERFRYRGTVPEGYRLVTQPINGLRIGGAVAFAVAYALPNVVGLLNRDPTGLIPLVGPFLLAGNAWVPSGGIAGLGGLANFFLVLGAAAAAGWQGIGIGMVIAGSVGGKRWLEAVDAAPSVTLVPGSGGSVLGGSVVGRF